MSRKRRNKQQERQAVPVEVVAEGSGPHESVLAEDGTLGVRVVEMATEPDAADAASDAEVIADADADAVAAADVASDADAVPAADSDSDPAADLDAVMAADVPSELDASAPAEIDGEATTEDAAELDETVGATLPASAASMDGTQLRHLVEALVFASDKPMTLQRLRQLTRVSDTRRLEAALVELAHDYEQRGLVLQQVSGGYQFRTQTRYSMWVQQLIAGRPVRLSRAQLETLAIVAYRQPITRPEIDEIRGVDSSATLKLLLDRALIRILGKKEEVGRPMLYGTTKEFLDFFSLGDLRELPTLREYSELTPESRRVVSDRLGGPIEEPINTTDATDVAFDRALADEPDTTGETRFDDAATSTADAEPRDVDDAGPTDPVEVAEVEQSLDVAPDVTIAASASAEPAADPTTEQPSETFRITWDPADAEPERTLASIAERRVAALDHDDPEPDVEQMADALASLDPDRVVPDLVRDDEGAPADEPPALAVPETTSPGHDDSIEPTGD